MVIKRDIGQRIRYNRLESALYSSKEQNMLEFITVNVVLPAIYRILSMTNNFIIAVSVADIRLAPDPDSELVTQALMNIPALAGEVSGEWTHVMLPDYTGWVRSGE